MSTKKLIALSLIFVLAGFFLTAYVFADSDRQMLDSADLAKLREEQALLAERIADLEEKIVAGPVENTDPGQDSQGQPVEVEPEKDVVLVAYVKDEYYGVNTRTAPGTNNPLVERVAPKTAMVIVDQDGDWYRVKLESGNLAWVANWVVRVQEE